MADADQEILREHQAATQDALLPIILDTCRRRPGARGDYRLLYDFVLHDYYGLPMRLIRLLRQCPSPEAVARSYRRCVEKWPDDCLPTEPTVLKRRKYGKVYRDFFRRQYKPINLNMF